MSAFDRFQLKSVEGMLLLDMFIKMNGSKREKVNGIKSILRHITASFRYRQLETHNLRSQSYSSSYKGQSIKLSQILC